MFSIIIPVSASLRFFQYVISSWLLIVCMSFFPSVYISAYTKKNSLKLYNSWEVLIHFKCLPLSLLNIFTTFSLALTCPFLFGVTYRWILGKHRKPCAWHNICKMKIMMHAHLFCTRCKYQIYTSNKDLPIVSTVIHFSLARVCDGWQCCCFVLCKLLEKLVYNVVGSC